MRARLRGVICPEKTPFILIRKNLINVELRKKQ
jgi:hypothetical protein